MNKWFKFFVYLSFLWGIFYTVVGSWDVFSSREPSLSIASLIIFGIAPLAFSIVFLQRERNNKIKQQAAANQKNILLLAHKSGGMLTTAEVATNLQISYDDARHLLESYVDKGLAGTEISEDGTIVYRFRELVK